MGKRLKQIMYYHAHTTAAVYPKKDDNCKDIWITVMEEATKVTVRKRPFGRALQEQQRYILQAMAITVLCTLPGLAKYYSKTPGKSAKWMQSLLTRAGDAPGLRDKVKKHGYSAVILDYFMVPWMESHPMEVFSDTAPRGEQNTVSSSVLGTMVNEMYISKAAQLARQRLRVEQHEAPTIMKPTIHMIKQVTERKFPSADDELDSLPPIVYMPPMDCQTGAISWDADKKDEQQQRYGATSIFVTVNDVNTGIRYLKRAASAGVGSVSNAFIKSVFEIGSDEVELYLTPFVNACISGSIHKWAMELLLMSRLALIPKPNGDFRPLGIGSAIYRLINTTLSKKVEKEVSMKLQPHQFAVGIRDAGAILHTVAQSVFEAGTADDSTHEDCDILKIDIANAYNTMRRKCIYQGLLEIEPSLVRWFLLTHNISSDLVHSTGAVVGRCGTGVKQGDPLASMLFAVGLHKVLVNVHNLVRERHKDTVYARAFAYADDFNLVGDVNKLRELLPDVEQMIQTDTGMRIAVHKTNVVLARDTEHITNPTRSWLTDNDIPHSFDGGDMMGVPFGTNNYVISTVSTKVKEVYEDTHILKYFKHHHKYKILSMCINTRPQYLTRCLDPFKDVDKTFSDFDKHVTSALRTIMMADDDVFQHRIHVMRGLRQSLSGGSMPRLAQHRRYALRKARLNVHRFLTQSDVAVLLVATKKWKSQWMMRRRVFTPTADFDESEFDRTDIRFHLKGHTLGQIPDDAIQKVKITGEPQYEDGESIMELRRRVDDDWFAFQIWEHQNEMKSLIQQNHTIIAAQCLSQSCPNSGNALAWLPTRRNTIKDDMFVSLLRLRFGVPPLWPLPTQQCPCRERGLPYKLQDEPLHALTCRLTGRRRFLTVRHDKIRDCLARELQKVDGTTGIAKEPPIGNDERRADLAVTFAGTRYLLDIAIVCPSTKHMVETHHTHLQPGAAAAHKYAQKMRKYKEDIAAEDQSTTKFLPFVIETGHRIHQPAVEWLDRIAKHSPRAKTQIQQVYSAISRQLMFSQLNMIVQFNKQQASQQ